MIGIAKISESWYEALYPQGTLTWRGGVDHSISSADLACGEMPFALSASVKPGHESPPLWSTHQDLLCLRVTSPELSKVYTSLTASLRACCMPGLCQPPGCSRGVWHLLFSLQEPRAAAKAQEMEWDTLFWILQEPRFWANPLSFWSALLS